MAPELAISYAVGIVPSAAMAVYHFMSSRNKVRSHSQRNLQKNLNQVGLFWSESQGQIESLSEMKNPREDWAQQEKSILVMSAFGVALSWFGLFAQSVIIFSMRKLAVSRKEKSVMASPLVERELSSDEVKNILKEVQLI